MRLLLTGLIFIALAAAVIYIHGVRHCAENETIKIGGMLVKGCR